MLDSETLRDAFQELGILAAGRGKVIDIAVYGDGAVYGGDALMLALNFRIATRNVDAVTEEDQHTIEELAREIAERRQWSADWLNNAVRTYLSPNVDGLAQHHELFGSYPDESVPGLRVFVPTPAYLLAMKLMTMRIDPAGGAQDSAGGAQGSAGGAQGPAGGAQDFGEILNLMEIVGIERQEELVAFAAEFYPEARLSGRLHLGLPVLWQHYQDRERKDNDAAPR